MAIIYSDIDIELTQATDGDILRDVNEDAVINSIVNIINTMKGSRRMLPEFAASIQNILFEPIDNRTSNLIRNKIASNIQKWDNRVNIRKIIVEPVYDKNMYKCLMEFSIVGMNVDNTRTLKFVLRAY